MSSGLRVVTQGLVHIYRAEGHDVAALSGVDLRVDAGDIVGLLGPSGAGKSTLLTLLGGLFEPSAGRIFIGDLELTALSSRELDRLRATEVSLMLQGASRNLLPYLTPEQNIAFAQRAAGTRARSGGARTVLPSVGEVLDAVGLLDVARAPLSSLTPGDLQLVAVGVSVATRPGLLLADEPTSQLDHASRDQVLSTISTINAAYGTTVILVTHDPDVARYARRTVTIRDGRIGGEGRQGEEFAVVTADGFLPLPPEALETMPAGSLVRVHRAGDYFQIIPQDAVEPSASTPTEPAGRSAQQPSVYQRPDGSP